MSEVSEDGVFDSLPDEQQYTVDPADPLTGEVWAQTENTTDYLADDDGPSWPASADEQ